MNDSVGLVLTEVGSSPQAKREGDDSIAAPWLLLIHHLPPKPDYLRVKVRRRLERLGALPVKNSVYVLPNGPETMEDFHWLAREIVTAGGEATLCAASFLAGTSDDELVASFRLARAEDYDAVAQAAGALSPEHGSADLARLARRIVAVADIDHFESPARREAEQALEAAERRIGGALADVRSDAIAAHTAALRGSRWVTRKGVFVDRIASAWLIRRFIDPEARFAFVSESRYRPQHGELRFDMFEAEFTHDGDRCTFETLVARFGLSEPPLVALAEIVHDIDVKDDKYGRPETPGVAMVLQGIAVTTSDDSMRLERGAALFDELYATLGS